MKYSEYLAFVRESLDACDCPACIHNTCKDCDFVEIDGEKYLVARHFTLQYLLKVRQRWLGPCALDEECVRGRLFAADPMIVKTAELLEHAAAREEAEAEVDAQRLRQEMEDARTLNKEKRKKLLGVATDTSVIAAAGILFGAIKNAADKQKGTWH